MRLPKPALLLTLALTLAVGVAACDDDPVTPTVDGSITGTVAADGEPLQGVTLRIEGPHVATNTTGPDGTYAFTDVPVGSYVVTLADVPQDAEFVPNEKPVTLTELQPDATANFDGSFLP